MPEWDQLPFSAAFLCSFVYTTTRFSDINGVGFTFAVEFINALAIAQGRSCFVFGTQNVLQGLTSFVEKVAACFFEGTFELVGDSARYEGDGSVWAKPNIFLSFPVKREYVEEIVWLLLLLLLLLLVLLMLLLFLLLLAGHIGGGN